MPPRSERPLWQCPECRRSFANRNQTYACGRHDQDSHFERKPPEIRHHFRLTTPAKIDAQFESFLREAYAVGDQTHLR